MAGLAFRAATADDKVAAMQLINAAYMAEAFIKMPFAEERISEETYDACIANASEVTELLLAVDSESGAIQGTAMLNPPEGSAAGHGEGSAAAHLRDRWRARAQLQVVQPGRGRALALGPLPDWLPDLRRREQQQSGQSEGNVSNSDYLRF